MGNTYGIKIKNYEKNNILKDILMKDNQKILPFIHFISKLNRFQVENFPKNNLIKEFTLINFLTLKQNIILIDNMESGYFLKDLEYSLEEIPDKNKFILITNVLENSPASEFNIIPNSTILLGNEEIYFDSLEMISKNLTEKKFKFVLYNIEKNESFVVDFKNKFENLKNDKVTLGIECEFISRLKLMKMIDKICKETKENYNKIVIQEDLNILKDVVCLNDTSNKLFFILVNLKNDIQLSDVLFSKSLENEGIVHEIKKENNYNINSPALEDNIIFVDNIENYNNLETEGKIMVNNILSLDIINEENKTEIKSPINKTLTIEDNQKLLDILENSDNSQSKKIVSQEILEKSQDISENVPSKREIISNLLNEKEFVLENTNIFKNKNLIEKKIENLYENKYSSEENNKIILRNNLFEENTNKSFKLIPKKILELESNNLYNVS